MAIEIVSFPIKNGDCPVRYVSVYQRVIQIEVYPNNTPLLGMVEKREAWPLCEDDTHKLRNREKAL